MKEERKLLKDFVEVLDAYEGGGALVSCQGQAMDGYAALANFIYLARKAKTVLKEKGR